MSADLLGDSEVVKVLYSNPSGFIEDNYTKSNSLVRRLSKFSETHQISYPFHGFYDDSSRHFPHQIQAQNL